MPTLFGTTLAAAEGGGGFLSIDMTLLWSTWVLFILFAWVLGKFAWGPLLRIVDEREKAIRDSLASAEATAEEARTILAQHQEMLRGAGREREEILQRALKEADHLRADLGGKARAEAEQIVARARDQIQREKAQAIGEIRTQIADLAVEAAARIVTSSLSPAAQRKLVDEYIASLPESR